LADVLRLLPMHDTVVGQVTHRAPWSVDYARPAPLTVFALRAGQALFRPANGPGQPIAAGDLIVAQGSAPYSLTGSPAVVMSGTFPTVYMDLHR
jgi:hypothetical protein